MEPKSFLIDLKDRLETIFWCVARDTALVQRTHTRRH